METIEEKIDAELELDVVKRQYGMLASLAADAVSAVGRWCITLQEPLATATALRFGPEIERLAEFLEVNKPCTSQRCWKCAGESGTSRKRPKTTPCEAP